MGRQVIDAFTESVARHAEAHRGLIKFPCGVGTFSWYIGIGEGLGASADGRRAGEPVSSNFSPGPGPRRGRASRARSSPTPRCTTATCPRAARSTCAWRGGWCRGQEGTQRMAGLVRGFVETGGAMMTLTVVDTEELRAAQREPENYSSLRVRMGGWCAYFTMLSREQQEHHIRRQEGACS